ncbi:MAG: TIGR02221 family CRISPR-associated protein [Thermodesulfobacteriota bacterium]|nr:TIGR02221 family CRISPR-associated protein [Thermodesulfobacteriota bacterium]
MRKVYLSFIGATDYKPTIYNINDTLASENIYVQCAELEILGSDYFDVCYFVMTPTSRDKHFDALSSRLSGMGITNIVPIEITEELEAEQQWSWFETILTKIDSNDAITIDMTHGYRIVPIVFSAAINFLQKAKNITIEAVYYGAYEKNKDVSPIIDMKEFYIINEWADAVSRVVEDADARKLAAMAGKTADFQAGELNDDQLIDALEDLTNTIRNVDIHNLSAKAGTTLKLIETKKESASATGKLLLDLVMDKFVALTTDEPATGRYDKSYFLMQLKIINLLLEHKLFMQAYTVMREFVGSIGLIEIKKAKTTNETGRKQRNKAEIFVRMLTYEENNWNFENNDPLYNRVKPFYDKLKNHGVDQKLRAVCKKLPDYRNGFDHAWTSKPAAYEDIEEKGRWFSDELEQTILFLEQYGLLK